MVQKSRGRPILVGDPARNSELGTSLVAAIRADSILRGDWCLPSDLGMDGRRTLVQGMQTLRRCLNPFSPSSLNTFDEISR